METNNIFDHLPEGSEKEIFESIIKSNSIGIERIISHGHSSPESGWYDQAKNEWVIILQGAATIEMENGNTIDLGVGNYLNLPAHCRHRVSWTDPKVKTIWLAIHY